MNRSHLQLLFTVVHANTGAAQSGSSEFRRVTVRQQHLITPLQVNNDKPKRFSAQFTAVFKYIYIYIKQKETELDRLHVFE